MKNQCGFWWVGGGQSLMGCHIETTKSFYKLFSIEIADHITTFADNNNLSEILIEKVKKISFASKWFCLIDVSSEMNIVTL